MRNYLTAIAIGVLVSACGESEIPVSYYAANPEEGTAKMRECRQKGVSPFVDSTQGRNCRNAYAGVSRASERRRLEASPPRVMARVPADERRNLIQQYDASPIAGINAFHNCGGINPVLDKSLEADRCMITQQWLVKWRSETSRDERKRIEALASRERKSAKGSQ